MEDPEEDPVRDGFLGRLTRKAMGSPWFSSDLRRPPPFRIGRHTAAHRRTQARTLRMTVTIALVLAIGWVGMGLLEGWARLLVPAGGILVLLGYARLQARVRGVERRSKDLDGTE